MPVMPVLPPPPAVVREASGFSQNDRFQESPDLEVHSDAGVDAVDRYFTNRSQSLGLVYVNQLPRHSVQSILEAKKAPASRRATEDEWEMFWSRGTGSLGPDFLGLPKESAVDLPPELRPVKVMSLVGHSGNGFITEYNGRAVLITVQHVTNPIWQERDQGTNPGWENELWKNDHNTWIFVSGPKGRYNGQLYVFPNRNNAIAIKRTSGDAIIAIPLNGVLLEDYKSGFLPRLSIRADSNPSSVDLSFGGAKYQFSPNGYSQTNEGLYTFHQKTPGQGIVNEGVSGSPVLTGKMVMGIVMRRERFPVPLSANDLCAGNCVMNVALFPTALRSIK